MKQPSAFTLFTPTGDRPEAFALCEKWMARQTLQPIQWIVYDDGETPTRCTMGQEYIYCPDFRGRSSLVNKLREVLDSRLIIGNTLAIIEDDDWYAPNYLEIAASRLRTSLVEVVGEGCALYYNVNGRWWYCHTNMAHASLCQTVLSRLAFPMLRALCDDNNPFIDVRFWKAARCVGRVFNPNNHHTTIGIKSMPGRKGYGRGHRPDDSHAKDDFDLSKLRSLIGADASLYAPFYQHEKS